MLNFWLHQCCYSNKHTWTKQNGKMGKSQNRNRSGLTPWVRRRRRRRSMWLKVTVLFSFLFLHIEYAFGYTSAANICVSRFFFFFFGKARFCCCFQFSVGPMYCSWDPQTSLFSNFFIKNGSYGTIYIFKNYFTIVFSVFSFQQNKRYPNGSWVQIRTNNNLYIRFVVKIL